MGRRIWVVIPTRRESGIIQHHYDCRVLSFKQWLPADRAAGRDKHIVQLWTDSGMRTLSLGSIRLQDPAKTGEIIKAPRRVSADAEDDV